MYVFAKQKQSFLTGNTSDICKIQVPKHKEHAGKQVKTKICK